MIEGFSLEVKPGEFIALFGHNGAGKTTLLKVLSGQLKPESGEISADPSLLSRDSTGFISHQGMVYPDLTGRENLELFARLCSLPEPPDAAGRMIRRIGLEADGRRKVRDYSRGMLQRLSLGRALLNDPALLLLDEPFTGLDRHASEFLELVLAQGKEEGKTIIMATHNLRRGFAMADRILVLDRGQLALDLSTGETSYETFVSRYGEITGK